MNRPLITVHDEINKLGIIVNFIFFENICNRKSDPSFNNYQKQVLSDLIPTLSKEMLKKDPILEGYRELRAKLGLPRSKTICSTEALLKFVLNKGTLPRVNLLVDIYNLLSVKTHISIGAHALEEIEQSLDFRITTGDETFISMGSIEPVKIQKGEYAYIDGSNEVLCRLDHRQCDKTRITESTQSCILIVQGNPYTTHEKINRVTEELIQIIHAYCGGNAEIFQH